MKKCLPLIVLLGLAAAVAAFWGCQIASPTGTVRLSITDAPVHNPDIDGVWLTIGEVQYRLGDDESGWRTFGDFQGPHEVNLLDYQNGLAYELGELELPGGRYNQIRFLLHIPDETEATAPGSPGCWVSFRDGTTAPLFVPSGLQSGYKAVGSFLVPVNGTVSITADFDLHKALRLTANGKRYLLQPTIRLVVDDQAGAIEGPVTNLPADKVMVFAYEGGTYTDAEEDALLPGDVQFPNSVAGAAVDPDTQRYRIAFLAEALYDLVVATVDPNTTLLTVNGFVPDVPVASRETTQQAIDMLVLAPAP